MYEYLQSLRATEVNDYSWWKATKRLKKPPEYIPPIRKEAGQWARSETEKADSFVKHVEEVFRPHNIQSDIQPTLKYCDGKKKEQFILRKIAKKIEKLNQKN